MQRLQRTDHLMPPKTRSLSEATIHFWTRVEISWPDECWLWMGATNRKGYGKLKWANSYWQAHRFAWQIAEGSIPNGLCVLHSCDNPPCVNPDHLFLGTLAENNADMIRKGRFNAPPKYGTRNGRSKLTEGDVLKVRDRYSRGETYISIAEDYPVTFSAIARAIKRKNWRHI